MSNVRTLEQVVARSLAGHQFNTLLLGLFAALALVLAVVGIYGVMSYTVTQRTHQIGIRMALGASQRNAVGLIMRHGAILSGIGVTIGLGCSLGLTRFLERMLFGVTQTDPASFAAVSLLLMFAAVAASYVPARRASRVDPLTSLRYE